MEFLFKITYDFLKFLERLTGLSYEEINTIIWFFLIPFTWAFLLDKVTGKHHFKIGFAAVSIVILLAVPSFEGFANSLFARSVDFLNYFNIIGSTYKISSVMICLFIPVLVYIFLIRKAYFNKK